MIPRLEHSFTDYVSDGNATCTQDGTKTAKCDNGCGETDTVVDVGMMLEHEYEWQYNNDATCEKNGKSSRKRLQRQQAKKNVFVNAVVPEKQKLFL